MFSHAFNIIIDCGISALGYVREVLDGFNAIVIFFIFHLMAALKLPGSQWFDTKITIQTTTHHSYAILENNFKRTCLMNHTYMVLLIIGNTKSSSRKRGEKESITCKNMKTLSTKMIKCILQTNFLYFYFVVHTTNHMVHMD